MRGWSIVMLAAASVASAGPRTTVAIGAVDLGPGVPTYLQPTLRSQIVGGLAAAAYDVKSDVPRGELATCRDGDCIARVGHALDVDQIVFASITAAGESRVIDMRLYDAHGTQLATLHEVCDLCGESELLDHVGLSASALRARAVEPPHERRRSKVPGFVAITAGTVVLGVGIALVALDGRGSCSAGDMPVYPDPGAVIRYPDPTNHAAYVCRDLYATGGLGIGGITLGVAGIALGVGLIVRARAHDTVQVTPTPGGATIGMTLSW